MFVNNQNICRLVVLILPTVKILCAIISDNQKYKSICLY